MPTAPRFTLVLTLALAAAAAGQTDLPAPPPPTPDAILRVGILPDRTGGPHSGIAILQRAVAELHLLAPDFVVNVGDMVQGYTWSRETWLAQCSEYQGVLAALDMRWFPTAGNHDVFPGLRGSTDRTNETLYKQHFGPLWYSYSCRGIHFVHLYSDVALTSVPAFGDEQTAWLRADLAAHPGERVFVFLHKPAWAYGDGAIWEPIHQILVAHGHVEAVIAGHFHAYQKCADRDGIAYSILGAAGGHLHKPEHGGGFHHYCMLTIGAQTHRLAVVKVGGVEPDDIVLRSDYIRIDANGSYGNNKLWVAGDLPEPSATAGASGTVTVHLANMADEPRRLEVTVASAPYSGWRLAEPVALDLAAKEERDVELALSSGPWPGGAPPPPTLDVHFPVTDSRGRVVDPARPLRVPMVRRAELRAGRSVTLRCDDYQPDYMNSPGDPQPLGLLGLNARSLTLTVLFQDDDVASYPLQRPDADIVSDAIEVRVGDRQLLFFPFAAEGDTPHRIWLRRGDGKLDPAPETVTMQPSYDGTARQWHVDIAIARELLDLPAAARGTAFQLTVYDNDFSGYTDVYQWVRPRRDDTEPPRGILVVSGE